MRFSDRLLGMLDTLGYIDFANGEQMAEGALLRLQSASGLLKPSEPAWGQPLYIVRAPIDIEGEMKLMSALKKNPLGYRTYDPRENASLSLYEANRQVSSSLGVAVHLLSHDREGAQVHNARCALLAGMAMGYGKGVLMLQAGPAEDHPIDYRDLIRNYAVPDQIRDFLLPFFDTVIRFLQPARPGKRTQDGHLLEKVDLGDTAAENEVQSLAGYFVPTGDYESAKRGQLRIVAGRKGSGKSAIFYRIREAYWRSKSHLVVDIRPEGYQFTLLKEAVLAKLTPGLQEYALTALWHYLLLLEMAHRVVFMDSKRMVLAHPELGETVKRIEAYHLFGRGGTETGDFSERLLGVVERLSIGLAEAGGEFGFAKLTELIYEGPIQALEKDLSAYLSSKDQVWILVDNIDKGWPVRRATQLDIMVVRCLLEATRKIQHDLERLSVELKSVVFIRDDIYELLLGQTPDRGKKPAKLLLWDDPLAFKRILEKRFELNPELPKGFDAAWRELFELHVRGEDTFNFILSRTLMRPRDVLRFVQRAIGVALNRGRQKVLADDILHAEVEHSEEMLQELYREMKDAYPDSSEVLYHSIGRGHDITAGVLTDILLGAGVPEEEFAEVRDLLLWYGFLGVRRPDGEELYTHAVGGDVKRLSVGATSGPYVVHSAFRQALS
jgi:hypothetical protein